MSGWISLSEAPNKLLDQNKWAQVRAFAPNDLIALTFLNAPYPDPEDPSDFFWGRDGSPEEAVRCYDLGRDLVSLCRHRLIEGSLAAVGTRLGERQRIEPSAWVDMWPMFATNRASGPIAIFDDVELSEALETSDAKEQRNCKNWLREQSARDLERKKALLFHLAKRALRQNLTQSNFDAAYRAILGHPRGRPKKSAGTIS